MTDEFQTKDDSLDSVTGHDPTIIVEVPDKLGCYQLLRLLGRGGMGEVWLAHDTKLDREVAIKLMRRELMAREDAVKRFYREARAVARLNHPNIVQVYAIGEERSLIYMVMEYVDGETVAQRLKRLGPLPLKECVSILLQAVEGLGYAYARGIIHRDIKPSNMMLTSDFRVKIADFGLAKIIEHDSQMTVAGTAIGSPNYMSPEQARGEEADHRSDIYALGISFYQMLTNELPFTGQTPLTVLLRQIQDPLPEPESLRQLENGRVLEIIKKMTAKNPEERFQTYGGLAAALASLAPDIKVQPAAHAITSTVPTPPGSASADGEHKGESTGEADIRTHLEQKPQGGTSAEATVTMPAPAAARDRLVFASIMTVAITVLGVVAIVAVLMIFRSQPPSPGVEVQPRLARETPAPTSTPAAMRAGQVASPTPTVVAQTPPPTPPLVGWDVAQGSTPGREAGVSGAPPVRPTDVAAAAPRVAAPPRHVAGVPPRVAGASRPGATQGQPTNQVGRSATPFMPPPVGRAIVLGARDAVAGEKIPLYKEPGQLGLTLDAGTRLPTDGTVDRGPDGKFYKVSYQGQPYLVKLEDARLEVYGAGPGRGAAPRRGLVIRLGTPDDSAGVSVGIFGYPKPTREIARLPAGTELPAEEVDDPPGYRVRLPDGKVGFVFKKMAQPVTPSQP